MTDEAIIADQIERLRALGLSDEEMAEVAKIGEAMAKRLNAITKDTRQYSAVLYHMLSVAEALNEATIRRPSKDG